MRGDLRDRCRQCSPKAIGSTSGNSPHKDRREGGRCDRRQGRVKRTRCGRLTLAFALQDNTRLDIQRPETLHGDEPKTLR